MLFWLNLLYTDVAVATLVKGAFKYEIFLTQEQFIVKQ